MACATTIELTFSIHVIVFALGLLYLILIIINNVNIVVTEEGSKECVLRLTNPPFSPAFLTLFAESSNQSQAAMSPPAQGSVNQQRLAKTTSVGFIENLNSKLAEQRLSGKAYAVRSLINSKALVMDWDGV